MIPPSAQVSYGIAHKADAGCIFFLNPGTAMNHSADAAVEYKMDVAGEMELWTRRPIAAGEEWGSPFPSKIVQPLIITRWLPPNHQ